MAWKLGTPKKTRRKSRKPGNKATEEIYCETRKQEQQEGKEGVACEHGRAELEQ